MVPFRSYPGCPRQSREHLCRRPAPWWRPAPLRLTVLSPVPSWATPSVRCGRTVATACCAGHSCPRQLR
eukprot:5338359-Alexandrium_andersonii.AAC.1